MAHPIQIILTRQLAGYLSVPTFLVDPNGTLLFYNEPAEVLLGRRFDETGAMPAEEWSTIFAPVASFSVQSPCSGSSVNNARDALRNSRLDTCAWT